VGGLALQLEQQHGRATQTVTAVLQNRAMADGPHGFRPSTPPNPAYVAEVAAPEASCLHYTGKANGGESQKWGWGSRSLAVAALRCAARPREPGKQRSYGVPPIARCCTAAHGAAPLGAMDEKPLGDREEPQALCRSSATTDRADCDGGRPPPRALATGYLQRTTGAAVVEWYAYCWSSFASFAN
jgi:hypothetical protein